MAANDLNNGIYTTWTNGKRCPRSVFSKRVHGAGGLNTRRFEIEVDIIAATSLLKHAACFSFQHLVKSEIISCLASTPEVRMPSVWWGCANC